MSLIMMIKVVPSSGHSKWAIDKSGILKVYLKSSPEKGLANEELVKTIAKVLRLPQSEVVIISGATARIKRVKINIRKSYDEVIKLLGIEQQLSIIS